jgi:HlyD family secretion protein
MKRRAIWLIAFVAVVGIGAAIATALPDMPDSGRKIVPMAQVTRGALSLTVFASGDLRAGRTTTLMAPAVGGMLRIVEMQQTGAPVKKDSVLVQFDPTDQHFAVEQARTEVAEADQEIVKMKADAVAQAAQDEVSLLTARFEVRRAELDASANEFIGAIDAKKNLLSLEEAKRRLAQLEEDVKSRAATNQASLAVVQEKRNKALLAMERAKQVIESLTIRAPMDGVVVAKENRDAMGNMMVWGMPMPEYRAGDNVWPGRPIVDVIETGRMELRAKVNENDRANLIEGQIAEVDIDTIPGETFKARVGALGEQARRAGWMEGAADSTRQFDVSFHFEQVDPRMKAGSSARVTVEGKAMPDVLTVPRQAVFQKSGKTHVFVKVGDRFEQREIKLVHRTESRAAIEGLSEGTEVALVDPSAVLPASGSSAASPMPGGAQ